MKHHIEELKADNIFIIGSERPTAVTIQFPTKEGYQQYCAFNGIKIDNSKGSVSNFRNFCIAEVIDALNNFASKYDNEILGEIIVINDNAKALYQVVKTGIRNLNGIFRYVLENYLNICLGIEEQATGRTMLQHFDELSEYKLKFFCDGYDIRMIVCDKANNIISNYLFREDRRNKNSDYLVDSFVSIETSKITIAELTKSLMPYCNRKIFDWVH